MPMGTVLCESLVRMGQNRKVEKLNRPMKCVEYHIIQQSADFRSFVGTESCTGRL